MVDPKAIGRRMTRTYALALALVGALATGGFAVSSFTSAGHDELAKVINVSGKQRMLSQRTLMLAKRLALVGASQPGNWSKANLALRRARDEFVAAQKALVYGDEELGLTGGLSEGLRAVHYDAPHRLAERFDAYVTILNRVVDARPGQIAEDDLTALYEQSQRPLLAALQAAVIAYEDDALASLQQNQMLGRAMLGTKLLVLLLISLLIFRPMVRNVVTKTQAMQKMKEDIEHTALHDSLTGLPNRRYLEDYLTRTLANADRNKHEVGLMHVDLDKFKQVNDTYGHAAGDAVLAAATEIMKNHVRRSDFVARVGGDEFIIVAPEVSDPRGLEALAARLVSEISQPIPWEGHNCQIGASVGIALSPPSEMSLDRLIHDADVALYEAKNAGRNTYRFHSATLDYVEKHYPEAEIIALADRRSA